MCCRTSRAKCVVKVVASQRTMLCRHADVIYVCDVATKEYSEGCAAKIKRKRRQCKKGHWSGSCDTHPRQSISAVFAVTVILSMEDDCNLDSGGFESGIKHGNRSGA